jgi:hypothetical protein
MTIDLELLTVFTQIITAQKLLGVKKVLRNPGPSSPRKALWERLSKANVQSIL